MKGVTWPKVIRLEWHKYGDLTNTMYCKNDRLLWRAVLCWAPKHALCNRSNWSKQKSPPHQLQIISQFLIHALIGWRRLDTTTRTDIIFASFWNADFMDIWLSRKIPNPLVSSLVTCWNAGYDRLPFASKKKLYRIMIKHPNAVEATFWKSTIRQIDVTGGRYLVPLVRTISTADRLKVQDVHTVVSNLVWTSGIQTKIISLYLGKRCKLYVERGEMCSGNLFIECLGKHAAETPLAVRSGIQAGKLTVHRGDTFQHGSIAPSERALGWQKNMTWRRKGVHVHIPGWLVDLQRAE